MLSGRHNFGGDNTCLSPVIIMIIRLLSILLLAGSLSSTAFAQAQSTQSIPDSTAKKIDALFSRWNSTSGPGCAIGIVRGDSLIYSKGFGLANLEYGIPNSPETIFHIASVSKQFTGYAIVLLASQGKLKLDDDVRQYLKWFPDLKAKITIRQLLNHTSGIRDQWQLLAIAGTRLDDVIKQDQITKILSGQQALNFKPGEKYTYSNSGYTMLAEIVKVVSGKSLRQYTDSAIFKPLGMSSTHFHDDYTEIVKNRASSYDNNNGKFSNSILSYSTTGATSLFTTVKDMSKWLMNFYQPKAGTAGDITTLTTVGKLNDGQVLDYALGIMNRPYKGETRYVHNGSDAGFRTAISIYPELKMGFVVFGNVSDFNSNTVNEMAALFIKDKTVGKTTAPAAPDSSKAVLNNLAAAGRFTGNYLQDDGTKHYFILNSNKLYWEGYGRKELLVPAKNDTFQVISNPQIKFHFTTGKSGIRSVKECWPGGRNFTRYTLQPKLTPAELKTYIGRYYSPELDCSYEIKLKDGSLILTNAKYEDMPVKLTTRDHMDTGFWWMEHSKIIRNSKQQIIGFEINCDRVEHLRFNKM